MININDLRIIQIFLEGFCCQAISEIEVDGFCATESFFWNGLDIQNQVKQISFTRLYECIFMHHLEFSIVFKYYF